MRIGLMGLGVVVLALALGCGGPPADDGNGVLAGRMTPAEAAEHLQALENDALALANGLVNGTLGNLVAGLPSLSDVDASVPLLDLAPVAGVAPRMQLPGQTSWTLAVGTWVHDELTGRWSYEAGPTDALRVRWRAQTDAATQNELSLTWTSVTSITLPDGTTLSVPVAASLVAHEGTRKVVDLTIAQSWRPTICGVHEAHRVAVSGTAGDGAAGVTLRSLALAAEEDTWSITGGVDLRSGSLTVAVDVNSTVSATIERDLEDCTITGFAVQAIDLGLSVASPVRTAGLTGRAQFVEVTGGVEVRISAGRFTVGTRRVDIGGIVPPGIDDPATVIALTFAEGEVLTLRQFLDRYSLFD